MNTNMYLTESNPSCEISHQDKIEFMTTFAIGHKRRMWSLVSSSRLHDPQMVDGTGTPLAFNETDDGVLPSFALQIKHKILFGITLNHSNGPLQTMWLTISIRSRNNLTEKWLSTTKSEAQQSSFGFQYKISLESMLKFFNAVLIFPYPDLDLLEKKHDVSTH